MTTYILTFYSSLNPNDRYRMRDENGTAISDADLATIFGSDGKARFILDWDGNKSESPLQIQIRNSSNTVVISYTAQKALLPAQLYEGTWTGGASTFTSFTPVEGKTLSEDELNFLMRQIKSAQASGIKTLTTADYNWPTTGTKTHLATYLLDAGIYKVAEVLLRLSSASNGEQYARNGDVLIVVDQTSSGRKVVYFFTGGTYAGVQRWATEANGSLYDGGVYIAQSMLTAQRLRNNLTAQSYDSNYALDARQGKVLADRIGDLSALTTTDKTSAVAAINEIAQSSGGGTQSDWSQNDPEAADYIKNRIAYEPQTLTKTIDLTTYSWGGHTSNASSATDAARKTAMMNAGWTEAQADFYNAHKVYDGTLVPAVSKEYDYNTFLVAPWEGTQNALSETDAKKFKNIPVESVRVQFTDIAGYSRDVTISLSKKSDDTSTDGFVLSGAGFYVNSNWNVSMVGVWQDSQIGLIVYAQEMMGGSDYQIASGTVTITTQGKELSANLLPAATASVKGAVSLGQIGGAVQNGDYLRKYTTGQSLTALDLRQAPIVDWDSASLTSPETIKNKPFGSIPAGTTYPFGMYCPWYSPGGESITTTGTAVGDFLGITQTDLDNALNNTIGFICEDWDSSQYYWTFTRSNQYESRYCEYLDALADAIDNGSAPTASATGTYTSYPGATPQAVSFSFSGFTKGADGVYRSAKEIDDRWNEWGSRSTFYGMCFEKTSTGYKIYMLVPTTYGSTYIGSVYPYSGISGGGMEGGSYSLTWGITTTAAGVKQIDASYIPLDMTVFQIVDGKITLRN